MKSIIIAQVAVMLLLVVISTTTFISAQDDNTTTSTATDESSSTQQTTLTSATGTTILTTTSQQVPTTTTATPPPPSTTTTTTTTVPESRIITFTLTMQAGFNATNLSTAIAAAIGNGCTQDDIHVVVDANTVTVEFIGSKAADYSHRFLYNVLSDSSSLAALDIQSFTYALQPASGGNGGDGKEPGVDIEKVIIGASVVGAIVIIVLFCACKSGKCKVCGKGDNNTTFQTPRGNEMSYQHDDLEEYRKIK